MNERDRWTGTILILALLLMFGGQGGAIIPGPSPSVAPIPEPGLHVLVVSETVGITPQVAAVLNSPGWQSLVPQGNWRIYDPDSEMDRDAPKWQAAMKRPRSALPWVIISNHPHGGYEGPLPSTLAELVSLIKRVGALP